MKLLTTIAPSMWTAVPLYRRVVVTCSVERSASVRAQDIIAGHVRTFQQQCAAKAEVLNHPAFATWRAAFKDLGINPNRFRPAAEALVRRAALGTDLVLGQPLVDLGTAVTLATFTPVGMHKVNSLVSDLELRPAEGEEVFRPFTGDDESPARGEVIYTSGGTVLTRRWVWRQGRDGSMGDDEVSRLAVNIDVLPGSSAEAAVHLLLHLLDSCGASGISMHELTATCPEATLSWS